MPSHTAPSCDLLDDSVRFCGRSAPIRMSSTSNTSPHGNDTRPPWDLWAYLLAPRMSGKEDTNKHSRANGYMSAFLAAMPSLPSAQSLGCSSLAHMRYMRSSPPRSPSSLTERIARTANAIHVQRMHSRNLERNGAGALLFGTRRGRTHYSPSSGHSSLCI